MSYSYKAMDLSAPSQLCQCCYSACCSPWACGHPRKSQGPAHYVPVLCGVHLPELFCVPGLKCWRQSFIYSMEFPPMCASASALTGCHWSFVKRHHPIGGTARSWKKDIAHSGRKVIFAITEQNTPSKCINQWEPGHLPVQGNYGDGGWGSVVHLPNASQG